MAKRKNQGRSFAARKAEEAKAKQDAEQRRQLYTYAAIGAAVLLALVLLAVVLPRLGGGSDSAENGSSSSEGAAMAADRAVADLAPAERNGFYSSYPDTVIDESKRYEATVVTEKGDIVIELFDDAAPLTVNNFVFLANEGFYDGTTFHRVLEDFMAQAGDPSGTGSGGPGYSFGDEVDNGFAFDRAGLLAMANAGPGTNGSQFFITYAETPWLTGNHTIFGEVLDGMDVLNELTLRDPNTAPSFTGDLIERIEITEFDG